jgi:two-component system chemotaxis response regulator CheY
MAGRSKPRILIADDEALYRLMIKSMLQTIQCEVVGEAKDGEEAVELFRSRRPDLVLMDITMPGMDGEAALQNIKAEFPGARVVMLTSLAGRDTVKNCANLGAIQYIRKDMPPSDMRALIQKIVQPESAASANKP